MKSCGKVHFKREGEFWVYIVECANGTYYTGSTNDLGKRIKEHNCSKRGAKYTRYKRPVTLAWSKKYKYFKLAVLEELRIKKLRRWQKEELISAYKK